MNAPNTESVVRQCPQCGAEYAADTTQCWLCHAPISEPLELVVAQLVAPPPPAPTWKLSDVFFASLSALTALLIVLIGIGCFVEEFGMGIVYVIVVTPPLAVTILRTYFKIQAGKTVSWAERFATFIVSGVVMAGILGMLAVAAVVCLIIMCFVDPPSFH